MDKTRKRVVDQQNAILKSQEQEAKVQSKMDVWSEAAHSTSMTGKPRNHHKVKAFNPDLYSSEDAKMLKNYAEFSLGAAKEGNRNVATPGDVSGKREGEKGRFQKVDLADRQDKMKNGTGGGTHLAEGYKHVFARDKDDLDRDFRLLGRGGDFSEVRYQVPDDNILEFSVRGPAMGRRMKREAAEKARLDAIFASQESEADKKKRLHEEAKVRRKAAAKKMKEDWRTNADDFTRTDMDFINEIQNMAISEKYRATKVRKTQQEIEEIKWQDFIGPKSDKMDYKEVDRILWQEQLQDDKINVRDQLKGRVMEIPDWEPYKADMENNRYFQGVQDDQLKEYRIDKRNKVLDEVMIKYAGTASDLVQKRDQLIKEGYSMPGESVDSFTRKLAGLDRRKNLWKMFKRMIVRKRAAFVTRTKDIWHGRGKRPLTKAEREMLLKESEALIDASDQGNPKLVKLALRYFADVDHRRDGRTSLQMVLKRLCWIDAGLEVEPTWQEGYKGRNRADYDGVMRILLEFGADINALEGANTDGFSVVHHAARLGCYDKVKYFLENGGKVDLRTSNGDTALMFACQGGHLDVIMLLIYTKHDILAKNEAGMTMLHFACLTGNFHVLNFLLETGADKNVKNGDGMTPLDICMERRFMVCAEKLQKFKMPQASMKDLIGFWRSIQDEARPESRSLFGSLNSRGSSRGSGRSWRQTRASAGRFLEKNKLKGATFGETGGKQHQKALRKKRKEADRKAREKEQYELENPKPENALSYLEGLIQNIPKPKTPIAILGGGRKKKKKKKNRNNKNDNENEKEGGEGGNGNGEAEEAGEKTPDEIELDNMLKEVEEEAGVKEVEEANSMAEGESGKTKKRSFFSPISMAMRKPKDRKPEQSSPEAVDLAAEEGVVRASVQRELFRKIATTFSPFKRKLKKEAEPDGTGSPGEDVVLPEIISSPKVEKREERIGEGEGDEDDEGVPKPKKRRRRKKKKKEKDEEGGQAHRVVE